MRMQKTGWEGAIGTPVYRRVEPVLMSVGSPPGLLQRSSLRQASFSISLKYLIIGKPRYVRA